MLPTICRLSAEIRGDFPFHQHCHPYTCLLAWILCHRSSLLFQQWHRKSDTQSDAQPLPESRPTKTNYTIQFFLKKIHSRWDIYIVDGLILSPKLSMILVDNTSKNSPTKVIRKYIHQHITLKKKKNLFLEHLRESALGLFHLLQLSNETLFLSVDLFFFWIITKTV